MMNNTRWLDIMEGQAKRDHGVIPCPYCKENHEFKLAKEISNGSGIVNVLQSLPCGNKILIFMTSNGEMRSFEQVHVTNALIFSKNDNPINYNQSYSLFARTKGLASKIPVEGSERKDT